MRSQRYFELNDPLMRRKIFLILGFLIAGSSLYLVIPFPRTGANDFENHSVAEVTTAFVPEFANDAKCSDDAFYIEQDQAGYSDSEIVHPRCARLQRELANAAIAGDLVQMRAALRKGASAVSSAFSKYSGDASRPIVTAAWNKQTEAVRLLLDNGADVNSSYVCCMNSKSLLMVSVSMDDEQTTRLLIDRGASLSFTDEFEGEDVFDTASRINNGAITAMLNDACERSVNSRVVCRTRRLRNSVVGVLYPR